MDKKLLEHLDAIVSAVTRGDYSRGKEIERMQESGLLREEDMRFLQSLGLMTVKLEAREFALEETIRDLKSKNATLIEEKRKSQLFSTIFVCLFLSVSLYVFLIFLARNLDYQVQDSARIVEAIFLGVCLVIIRKSGFSFSSLGVTFHGAADSIRLVLPSTLILCAALVALKGLLIISGAPGLDQSLFIPGNFDLMFALYLPVAIIQEFLARGVMQTAIASVLEERHSSLWAIITASALFGLVHIQLSVGVAFASFVFGMYWGHLYARRKCLAGVSLSHFLIGDTAYVLGLWDYLHII